jgi:hypothetical protein
VLKKVRLTREWLVAGHDGVDKVSINVSADNLMTCRCGLKGDR